MRIVLLLFLLIAAAVEAQPLVNTRSIYYTVSPESTGDILSALNKVSPVKQNGKLYHAYTDAYVEWKFWWNVNNGRCAITNVEVKVDVTFTLPKLAESSEGFEKVKAIWSSWYPNLLRHEDNHKNHAVKIAEKIESA